MGSIGHIIKKVRLEKSLKQIVLAKGICSTSYLSKVENNQISPNEEIISSLLKRLEVSLKEISNEDEFLKSHKDLYKQALIKRNIADIKDNLHRFNGMNLCFNNESYFFTYHLYILRLKLIVDKEINKLTRYVSFLEEMEAFFDLKQKYIFFLNKSLYYNLLGKKRESYTAIQQSFLLKDQVILEDWEKADLFNSLSVIYLKNYDYSSSVHFATNALSYYVNNLLFERAADSYIILGIAQKKMFDFERAEESFFLAKSLVESIQLSNFEGVIYHNLASLFAQKEDHQKAIEYYKSSFNYKIEKQHYHSAMATVLSIILEYAKLNSSNEVSNWCVIGLKLIQDNKLLNINNLYHAYYHHFQIYNARFNNIVDQEFILLNGIDYFESQNDIRYIQKYSIILADFYHQKNKYKLANFYYRKAISGLFLKRAINRVEDL